MEVLPVAIMVLLLAGALLVQATTRYVVEADRIVIRRSGFTWMAIRFDDVAEIQAGGSFSIFNITMTQPAFRAKLRIRRKQGLFPTVVINPREPLPVLEAFARFQAAKRSAPTAP